MQVFLLLIAVAAAAAFAVDGESRYPTAVISHSDSRLDEEASITVRQGDYIRIELEASGGTGYQWTLQGTPSLVAVAEKKAGPAAMLFSLPGSRTRWTFYLQAKAAGQETVVFCLARPGDPADPSARRFSLTIAVRP